MSDNVIILNGFFTLNRPSVATRVAQFISSLPLISSRIRTLRVLSVNQVLPLMYEFGMTFHAHHHILL